MPLFRCLNEPCGDPAAGGLPVFDFENADGVCPKCAASAKANPRVVVQRETVHYLVNDDAGPIRTRNGNRRVACDPAAARLPRQATAHAPAVSCPACKASPVLADHVAGNVDQSRRIVRRDVPDVIAGGTFNPAATE